MQEVQYVAIDKLIPYELNNKIHDEKQLKALARSIRELGFRAPILVDENRVILAGHGRLEGAKKARLKEVPVIQYTDLSEEQKKKYRILDNRIGDLADYNLENLKIELQELKDERINEMFNDFDLGLDQEEERDEDIEDDVPEVDTTVDPIVKVGDIFELDGTAGKHYIICGDSTKQETYDKLQELIGGRKFDMLFTDPPYNVDYHGSGKNTNRGIDNDSMGISNFEEFLQDTFSGTSSALKTDASMYIFHASRYQREFENAMNNNDIEVITQLIWNKPSCFGFARYKMKHEPFFYAKFRKGKVDRFGIFESSVRDSPDIGELSDKEILEKLRRTKEAEKEGRTTIWSMKRHNVNDYIHPTQKPVEIVEKGIINSSKEGEAILEPFLGSGTTLIASEKTGRICGGIELDPHFIEAIIKRYSKITGKNIRCINRDIDITEIIG